jgi:hypothetical protein
LNAPISVAGDTTSSDFVMFTVNIPLGQSPGPYDGSFTILGGPTADDPGGMDRDSLGSGSFEVDVNGSAPEPATIWLTGAALLMLLAAAGASSEVRPTG